MMTPGFILWLLFVTAGAIALVLWQGEEMSE